MGNLKACALSVKEQLGLDLEPAQIEEFLQELQKRVPGEKQTPGEFTRVAEIISVEMAERKKARMRLRAMDIDRAVANRQHLATFKSGSQGIQAILSGVSSVYNGAKKSIDYVQQSIRNEHTAFVADRLEREHLIDDFRAGRHDDDVAKELWARGLGETSATKNKRAGKIADILYEAQKSLVARANRAGTWIKQTPGYVVQQSHNRRLITKAGRERWKEVIGPRLDKSVMDRRGDMSVDEFLDDLYLSLSTGVHGRNLADMNIGERMSTEAALKFRDATAWFEYHQEFGTGKISDAFFHGLNEMSENIGLLEGLGARPYAELQKLKNIARKQAKEAAGRGSKSAERDLATLNGELHENILGVLTGRSRNAANVSAAHFGYGLRAFHSLTSLGGSMLSSVSDLATAITELRYQGVPFMESYLKPLTFAFKGRGTKEQKEVSRLIAIGHEGIMGHIAGRFSADDNMPGMATSALNLFFKLNLQTWWNDALKSGMSMVTSADLAPQIKSGKFRPETERMLKMYGIGEKELAVWKNTIWRTEQSGTEVVTPDKVYNVDDSVIKDYLGNPDANRDQIARARDDLATSMRSMFLDRADTAVPTPGARERALMVQNTRPGTPLGEVSRFFYQFKAFPITYVSRLYSRETMGRVDGGTESGGFAGFRQGLTNGLPGLVELFVLSTIMGYVAMSLKDIAKGREPRDPTDPRAISEAMIQGGGAGIYGDYLFGKFSNYGRSALDTAAGPTLGGASNLLTLRSAFRERGWEGLESQATNMAGRNIPFGNLFYVKAALDYLILFQMQERASPGYLRRMEARMRNDKGQEYFIPPSTEIPTGGGSRAFEGVR